MFSSYQKKIFIHQCKKKIFLCLFCAMIFGCIPFLDWRPSKIVDLRPPEMLGWKVCSSTEVQLAFNEVIKPIRSSPGVKLEGFGESLSLLYDTPMLAGENIKTIVGLEDQSGNSLDMVLSFYGFNPNIPQVVINEIRLEGTSSRPDLIEFKALSEGSLAGLSFYRGNPDHYDWYYVFPNVEVNAGDFILLHFVPEGIPGEVDELNSISESKGKEASDNARDFWLKKKEGLSATNGLLTLTRTFGGEPLDLFLYSNRTSMSDTKYRGFGSFTNLERSEWAFDMGEWETENPNRICPEDCFYPVDGTATRTICRGPKSIDNNLKFDWHIVPTGCCSFGEENSSLVY